ncbi:MAG: D-alanyl-D-alanine carboxypeptidase [Clostridia bacterium]|jgi:D-alanyl-D-alanine carboxypeptidase (penicillin-binding protein 5/6)|nr:D-alanyl-D-alanine carboxypeptidase [Clostridia bacterium]MCI2015597.1 D-alanyl-D-alanine carboxypeptidase [Clostridia bacterium]
MKAHKIILTTILALVLIIHPVPSFAEDNEDNTNDTLNISSQSAVLMEQSTGKVLYEKNSHESLPPASITKIMTLLLIYEAQKAGKFSWDDMVTVSEHAASMGGSQVFLEPNEQQTAATMTKCIAIASANDAAVAMAEFIGGSEEGFVKMMNDKAAELGMKDTTFKNACGLDTDGHVSSAYDIALMSRELMKNFPEIQKYTTTWMDTITHKTSKGESEFGLTNTNKLIKWYSGATGLKTGSTGKAKYCLSGTAQKDGMNLIAVVMAAPDNKSRFQEVMKMLNYGFAGYEVKNVAKKGGDAGDITVTKGKLEKVPIETADDVSVLMKKGSDKKITEDRYIKDSLQAPFNKGENAGEVVYMLDGKEVGRTEIVTSEGVEKAGYTYNLGRILKKWAA